MGFSKKRIDVTFTLAAAKDISGNVTSQPTFAGGDSNSVTLSGYRTSVTITKAGGQYAQGQLQMRIYGMSLALMNQLSTLGKTPIYVEGPQKNYIAISAGDDSGTSLIFQGSISQAFTDLGGSPEGVFEVSAFSLLYEALMTVPATSYKGPVDAALVLQGLATQMGKNFENNGVSVVLNNPYYHGSALSQVQDCIREAGIEWNQGDNGTIAIWPKGGSRGGLVPLLAAPDMVGYPYPSGGGFLGVRCVFNPQINFGGQVQVQSDITPANGTWSVQNLTHDIESEMPGGQWFTALTLAPPGYTAVLS